MCMQAGTPNGSEWLQRTFYLNIYIRPSIFLSFLNGAYPSIHRMRGRKHILHRDNLGGICTWSTWRKSAQTQEDDANPIQKQALSETCSSSSHHIAYQWCTNEAFAYMDRMRQVWRWRATSNFVDVFCCSAKCTTTLQQRPHKVVLLLVLHVTPPLWITSR